MSVAAPFQQMFMMDVRLLVILDLVLRLQDGSSLTLNDGSELVLG